MKKLLVFIVSCLFCAQVYAGTSTAGAFLKINNSAQSSGMGQTGVGYMDSSEVVFVNPAGMLHVTENTLGLGGSVIGDLYHTKIVSLVMPAGTGYRLGLSIFHMDYGNMERTEIVNDRVVKTGTSFTSANSFVSLAYAQRILPVVSVGLQVKFLKETIDGYDSEGYAFDIGLSTLDALSKNYYFGGVVKNIGSKKRFTGSSRVPLPREIIGGLSYKETLSAGPVTGVVINGELRNVDNEDTYFHLGSKIIIANMISASIGKQFNYDTFDFSYGLGFTLNYLHLSYALAPREVFDLDHKISLQMRF